MILPRPLRIRLYRAPSAVRGVARELVCRARGHDPVLVVSGLAIDGVRETDDGLEFAAHVTGSHLECVRCGAHLDQEDPA